jgi:hypothetical protein
VVGSCCGRGRLGVVGVSSVWMGVGLMFVGLWGVLSTVACVGVVVCGLGWRVRFCLCCGVGAGCHGTACVGGVVWSRSVCCGGRVVMFVRVCVIGVSTVPCVVCGCCGAALDGVGCRGWRSVVMHGGSGGLGSGGLPLPLLVGACCDSVRVERGESEGGVCVRLGRVLSGCGMVVCWQYGDGLW